MIIFVFIRMYTKIHACSQQYANAVSDPSDAYQLHQLSSVVFFGFMMALYVLGFGVHQWDITYVNLESLISKVLGSEGKTLLALWGPTMFFTKLSLLLLYHRIFAPDRLTKYLVYLGVFYCSVLYTSFLLLTFLLCQTPLQAACKHRVNLFILISSGLNVFADIYLLIIPIAAVAKLHMPLRQKLGVSAVFLTGMLACLSGILALYYRTQLLATRDITWHATPVFIFTVLEINTNIIISCLPTMPALIHDTRAQISATTSHKPPRCRSGHRHRSGRPPATIKKSSCQQEEDEKQQRMKRGQRQVTFAAVELDSMPVPVPVRRMEEARAVVWPMSFFSDNSSEVEGGGEGEEEDLGWLS
ncbi:MAG: hypothetical protein Q9185_004382 [Variospora sp. 1 TL-2023]